MPKNGTLYRFSFCIQTHTEKKVPKSTLNINIKLSTNSITNFIPLLKNNCTKCGEKHMTKLSNYNFPKWEIIHLFLFYRQIVICCIQNIFVWGFFLFLSGLIYLVFFVGKTYFFEKDVIIVMIIYFRLFYCCMMTEPN